MNSTSKYSNKDIAHKFDFQSRLGYAISGKRGGTPQIKDDIGYAALFIDNSCGCQYGGNEISVNAFSGFGDTYERRDKCEITICNDGKEVFRGTFDELTSKLANTVLE